MLTVLSDKAPTLFSTLTVHELISIWEDKVQDKGLTTKHYPSASQNKALDPGTVNTGVFPKLARFLKTSEVEQSMNRNITNGGCTLVWASSSSAWTRSLVSWGVRVEHRLERYSSLGSAAYSASLALSSSVLSWVSPCIEYSSDSHLCIETPVMSIIINTEGRDNQPILLSISIMLLPWYVESQNVKNFRHHWVLDMPAT